ncbi:MAG TPA: hypothetical protein VMH36_19380 [Alphaproteobacteria bacterium]|nr:hypothetical protein [Alphaproteobacteria bacterium]
MVQTRTYSRRDVEELLLALEQGATAVVKSAGQASAEAKQDKFQAYQEFKRRCDDFDTLSILIEHRLKNMKGGVERDLDEKFDELCLFLLSATLTASLHFLRILAERDALPLGSRDVFMRELRNLHRAHEKMNDPKYAPRINERTGSDLKVAEEILATIIERAPALLDFGTPETEEETV